MLPSNVYVARVRSRETHEVAFVQRFHISERSKTIFSIRLLRAAVIDLFLCARYVDGGYILGNFGCTDFNAAQLRPCA